MEIYLQWFGLFICTSINFSLQGLIISYLFYKKPVIKNVVLFALINGLFRELSSLLIVQFNPLFQLAFYFLTIILTTKFILKFKVLHTILSVCFLIAISSIIEYATMAVLQILTHGRYNITAWASNFLDVIFARNVSSFLLLIIVLIIYNIKLFISLPTEIEKNHVFGITLNTITVIILIIPNMIFFQTNSLGIPTFLVIFNALTVVALLIINIYILAKINEIEVIRQENEFQKLYINTLTESIDTLRGFKHDFNNVINTMGGYIQLNNFEGLKKFHSQLLKECKTVNSTLPLNNYVMENPAIYGLLLSKISFAETHEVNFNIDIMTEINIREMKIYDFCKVFGILLDNALESAEGSEKKFAELFISKDNKTNSLTIRISNNFKGEIDVKKVFNNGYTSKEGHSGFGLWEVNKIISKYKMVTLKTYIKDNLFVQELIFS